MISQTMSTFRQKSALQEGEVQLAEALKQREIVVGQSREIEKKLQDLILDLLVLANTDEEAKNIVAKYGIQQNGQPATPPAPAK